MGYNDETPGLLRVFGETPESCLRAAEHYALTLEWPRDSARVEPISELGPWWHSRFERVATGFEIRMGR